ncbi:hypothetical protein CRE_22483 [Caenorhabditis remanei]|uniref:Uncharacterized protein n=1 Tax=Caenorhabditis remanei TaxID=31234 RepID=E3MDW8_CAERE|nr:hypothetical protein CRE_22483 [Caenorhabditis remanei]
MTTRRLESTVVALKEKIEKTRNETKEKFLSLTPLEDERDTLKLVKQEAIDFNEEHIKEHETRLKGLDREMVQFQKDFHRRKRSAGSSSETDDFHVLLGEKRKETRQLREKFVKLKAEVLSGVVQEKGDAPSCEICTDEFNEDENLPKALGCGHTVCAKCLKNLNEYNDRIVMCPFCRKIWQIKNCPTNLIILNK